MFLWVAATACAMMLSSAVADTGTELSALLEQLPAPTIQEGQRIASELLDLGPEAIADLCWRILPPGAGDDTQARYAVHGLSLYVSRPGTGPKRRMVARVFLDALDSATDVEVKAFLMRQLQGMGKQEIIAPLSRYLNDERLCEPATQALLNLPARSVTKALTEALAKASGPSRVTLLVALGQLRERSAAEVLRSYARSEDEEVRQAALFALANAGDSSVSDFLAEAIEDASPAVREQAMALHLLCAKRLAERGRERQSVQLCREALRSEAGSSSEQLRCRALSTLVAASGRRALPDLLAALNSSSKPFRQAALELALAIPGKRATRAWMQQQKLLFNPEARAEIIAMLGRRGDPTALPVVVEALKDRQKVVRLSAIPAVTRLAGEEALPPLLETLRTEDADEILAVKEALLRLPGEAMLAAAAESLPTVPFPARVALLEILGARQARAQTEAIFAQTTVEEGTVRVAALKALAPLAEEDDLPRLIERLARASTAAEQSAAEDAVVSLAKRMADPQPAVQSLRAALPDAPAAVLKALARIGGPRALEAVLAEVNSSDESVQDAAVRALADWRDLSAAEALLDVACNSEKTTHQVLAWRGYIRLAGLAANSPPNEKLQMYKTALDRAQRPEEKRLALAGLAGVQTLEALRLVEPYLEDENLASEAAAAVVQIACPESDSQTGILDPSAAPILRKAKNHLNDDDLKDKANLQLSRIAMQSGEGSDPTRDEDEGFAPLFNGLDLTGWNGNREGYRVKEGKLVALEGHSGNLYTESEFDDFVLRFEFKLTPGANNGLAIRAPLGGNAAYAGMEIQILDNTAEQYKDLKPYQYHGSIYGVVPAKRGYLRPVGEWNTEEVIAKGKRIIVHLNGTTIVDADIAQASEGGTMDGQEHPGLSRARGHIGFLGHNSRVELRNLRIRELPPEESLPLVNELSEQEKSKGFDLIFDGDTLSGWKRHEGLPDGLAGKWTVEEGAIVGRQDPPGQGGFLTTLQSYRDFELRLETWIDWPFDSGVFLRVGPDGKSHQITLDYRPGGEIGGIYCSWTQGFVQHCTGGVQHFKRDAWNALRIICCGEPARIQVWLNDVRITDFQHTPETTKGVPKEGTLCLQVHPGGKGYDKSRALFRTIRVRELEGCEE